MLEILSPAGSPEGVVAAVQNGADAVYLGFGDYNARRNAHNFTEEDFAKAAEFCRIRGVKVYVTLNTLISDRELPGVVEQAKRASRLGADAILVQDLGVMRALRKAVPYMPLHASTQMSIHNLEGAKLAAAMGLSRVVLSRELSREEIAYICQNAPIEVEVFAHGALCMCYSGQCYMSAVIGRRSGNRGLCAQPCRLPYSTVGRGNDYPLSLKDSCLIQHLHDLETCGVKCLKIEGRMRRPEYSALVTGIYARAIKEQKAPTEEDMRILQEAFSRDGFTDGYFLDNKGPHMLGTRQENEKRDTALFTAARKQYLNTEYPRIPVKFVAALKIGEPIRIGAADDRGNVVSAEGPVPEAAFHKELTAASIQTQLYKTGGTPFICTGVKSTVDSGLALPVSAINDLRRNLLSQLMDKRKDFEPRIEGGIDPLPPIPNSEEPPVLTVSVQKADQLSPALTEHAPCLLYVPLEELVSNPKAMQPFMDLPGTTVAAVMPRVIHDNELSKVKTYLEQARDRGVTEVLTGNLGQILLARGMGFDVRGDFGLNVYNSFTVDVLKDLGLKSVTLSFEMRMEQIRDIIKAVPAELVVYGRLPLMVTENCIVKNSTGMCSCDNFPGLTDRNGFLFPVVKEFGCRNVILNSKKLYLADKSEDYMQAGLWGVRLAFTKENPAECAAVLQRYLNLSDVDPSGITRGLYYRGVE